MSAIENAALNFFLLVAILPTIQQHNGQLECLKDEFLIKLSDYSSSKITNSCRYSKFREYGFAHAQNSREQLDLSSRAVDTARLIADFAETANVGYVSMCVEGMNGSSSGNYILNF